MGDVIVGAGVVGLSCAYHLALRGRSVTVLDCAASRPPASLGNAGGIAVTECVPASVPGLWRRVPGWLLDPLGPLHLRAGHAARFLPWLGAFLAAGRTSRLKAAASALAELNARVYPTLEPMLADLGLSTALRRAGALTLYRDRAGFEADALEWQTKREQGVRVEEVGPDEIRELEPAVAHSVGFGVLTPEWSTLRDPAELVAALHTHLRAAGVTFVDGEARAITRDGERNMLVRLSEGGEVHGDTVTVAAGAWSASLARSAGDRALLESERGYNVTLPEPGVVLNRQVSFGAEKFVASPLAPGLRIGGAAEFAGLAAPANHRRSENLARLAKRFLPDLDTRGGTAWMGHRPTTPDSLPVIGPSPKVPGLYYAFGHGHLGLTQSAPTGEAIADLVTGRTPSVATSPFAIDRFERDRAPVTAPQGSAPET